MPTTVNGIGTIYLGKKNLRTRHGVCEHCKREVELASYETRLWFAFLVPVIPLRRKQIIDMCPVCRHHRAVDWADWQRARQEGLEKSAADLAARPDDPQAWYDRIACLETFGRTDDAAELAGKMGAHFRDDVEVQLEAAAWLEVHGRVDLAQGPLARAAELAPDRPDVRRAMGVTSCRQGRPDEARQALQFMFDDPAQRDPAALVLLGEAYQADQRHREALECFGAAQQASHGLSRDKSFRKTVRASEKQVPDAAVLPRRGLLSGWRGKLVLAGLLLSAALLVGEWFASRSVPLYVVNGLPAPVTVEVAGEKLTVSAGDWRKLAVGEGEHEATFSCPSAGLRGAHAFELHASLWSRLFNRRTHVLNPFAAAVLARERTVYAEDPDRYADEYKAELLLTGPYAALEGFHYRFEAYPEQIQMEGARETRTRLSLCEVPPFQAISAALAEENADMALALDALEAHCRADPGKVELLQLYHLLGAQQNQLERVMATLEAGLAVRPVRIGWHRFYQTVAIQQGRRQEVLDRYERLLAEAPDDPDRLYLAGRLGHGRRASMPYVQRALAREPAHAWALISRCYHELGAGEVAAAATTADALRPHAATNALAEHWWIHANWAAGEQRALRAHLRQKLREAPDDYGAMLGLLALRAPDADIGRFTTSLRDAHGRDADDAVRELRREAKYLQGAYDALLTAGRGLPPQQAAAVRLEGAAELGRLDVLRACLAELGQPNWTTLLTASIAAELAGDGEWAAALRVRAAGAALGDASADPRVAKLLREPASADLDTAADVDGEPIQKAVWLVALLQAGAPQDLAALARTLNYQPFFPHDLLDRALRKLGDGPS